jgi:glyoxylase-like metal-dependent hydrolase (beta-lactamase superfamily II)
MSTSTPIYNIYAVKYAGPLISSVAMVLWNTDWEKKIERNYYIWVVQSEEETLIVDCGITPALAKDRQIPGYVNPIEMLARLGVEASEVKRVVITHVTHVQGAKMV